MVWGHGSYGGDTSGLLPTFCTGLDASCAHLPWSDAVLPNNTGTFLELSGTYRKYNCPIARTVFLRSPCSNDGLFVSFQRMHAAVKHALAEACAAVVPGVTAESVFFKFNSVLKEHGTVHGSMYSFLYACLLKIFKFNRVFTAVNITRYLIRSVIS